jgi:ribonuclease R
MEKQAVDAERASIKYMQVMYLKEKIGEQYKGMISGLTDWGIYVELEENKCEGMIPLNSMKDDQYYYDSEKKITSGYGSKKTYKMGQEIKVMVKKADLHKRQIDFKIIN